MTECRVGEPDEMDMTELAGRVEVEEIEMTSGSLLLGILERGGAFSFLIARTAGVGSGTIVGACLTLFKVGFWMPVASTCEVERLERKPAVGFSDAILFCR